MATTEDPLISQEPNQTPPNDGRIAPVVQSGAPDEQNQSNYGLNNENLPKDLQLELWGLLTDLEKEDELPRRREVQNILKRRLFFRGEQYWWWDNDHSSWRPPFEHADTNKDEAEPTFQHVTNIFQAFCLSMSAILTQNTVPARFWPQSARNPIDVSTAKSASKIAELIHRNNSFEVKGQDAAYYLWTDGLIGSYTRYVSDAERFGTETQDVLGEQPAQIAPSMDSCQGCGNEQEAGQSQFGTCPQCGQQMQTQPPVMANVPVKVGEQEIPKGQEMMDVVPALNLKRSMWADDQDEFLYLTWVTDLHTSMAMAMYPHVEDEIKSGGNDSSMGSVDAFEKQARRMLFVGTGRYTGAEAIKLGTFRRAWIRPRAFTAITDKAKRAAMMKTFPKGAYVAFYNDVYCESRSEAMNDKWRTMQAMPGEGQCRETLGSALIPIQEQLNDAVNLEFETAMYGVPEGFAAEELIDWEARASQAAMPAQLSPVKLKANQRVGDMLSYSPAIEPSRSLVELKGELFANTPQFISGIFPALFGGETGANDTLGGITIQRNQALGRVGRAWRLLQEFWAQTDLLGVQCFAQNRTQDVETSVLGDGGKWKSEWLKLDDLQGDIVAFPEVDQQYPILQAEIRAMVAQMFQTPSPLFLAVASQPENLETTYKSIGLNDYVIPGEDQRQKTHNDIEDMLEVGPVPALMPQQMPGQSQQQGPGGPQPPQGPPQPGTPPQPGMPPQGQPPMPMEPQMTPSIVPDPIVDDLGVAFKTCQEWLRSDAGQTAKTDKPLGYQNVYLYAKACQQLQKQEQLMTAMAGAAMEGKGPAADMGGANNMPPPPDPNAPAPASGPPPGAP